MKASKFGYRFKTHCYFTTRCIFIFQVVAPTLLRVM